MRIETFLGLCEGYANLGGAVQDQMKDVILDGEDLEGKNGNALRMIQDYLERVREVADEDLIEDLEPYINDIERYRDER